VGWERSVAAPVGAGGADAGPSARPILVAGLPRGGTTWLAQTLASAPGTVYVHEPDNRESAPFGLLGTRGLWHDPDLESGDTSPLYASLWNVAFAGGWQQGAFASAVTRVSVSPRVPLQLRYAFQRAQHRRARAAPSHTRVIVKSVHAYHALEWIADQFRPDVVVVWRNPINMLASYAERAWYGDDVRERAPIRRRFEETGVWPPPPDRGVERVTWTICARLTLLLEAASRHLDWRVVHHEALSAEPFERYRALFDSLALPWGEQVEAYLREHDRPGEGWSGFRRGADERAAWKRRLTVAQAEAAASVLVRFRALWKNGSPLAAAADEVVASAAAPPDARTSRDASRS
jgi:hypothetical protein